MRRTCAAWLLLLGGLPCMAAAADLTVRFTGRFQSGTCQLSVADVDMGTYAATYFDTNSTSPARVVQLNRSNCSADLRVLHVRLLGTAQAGNTQYFAIPASGGVSGLAIRIYTPTAQTVVPNQPGFDWANPTGSATGSQTLYAALVRVGTVTAGTLRAPITVSVTYN